MSTRLTERSGERRASATQRALHLTVFVVLALLLANSILLYRATQLGREDQAAVTHSHEVLQMLAATKAAVIDAETGQRGFQITGDDAYLDPYNRTRETLLMDLQMPELDGYAAAAQLRSGGYDRPIIALTAHAMPEDRLQTLRSGFDRHLAKPIRTDELLDAVTALGRRSEEGVALDDA